MNYDHCVLQAAERVIEWNDVPDNLLPLMILSEVSRVSDVEGMGHSAWH